MKTKKSTKDKSEGARERERERERDRERMRQKEMAQGVGEYQRGPIVQIEEGVIIQHNVKALE